MFTSLISLTLALFFLIPHSVNANTDTNSELSITFIDKLTSYNNLEAGVFGHNISLSGNNAAIESANGWEIYEQKSPGNWGLAHHINDIAHPHFHTRRSQIIALDDDSAMLLERTNKNSSYEIGATLSYFKKDNKSNSWQLESSASFPQIDFSGHMSLLLSGDEAIFVQDYRAKDYHKTGAIYFMAKDNEGVWRVEQRIKGQKNELNFNGHAALDNGTALVHSLGTILVYVRDKMSGQWILEDTLITQPLSADPIPFRGEIAIEGDTAVAIAGGSSTYAGNRAYVFERTSTNKWVQKTILTPVHEKSSEPVNSFLIYSIDIQGNILAIGTYSVKLTYSEAAQGAFIFQKDSNGNWVQKEHLLHSDSAKHFPPAGQEIRNYPSFGKEVRLSENTLMVSNFGDSGYRIRQGAVYIYNIENKNADTDSDGVLEAEDNCPLNFNFDQENRDGDQQGDACDSDDDNDLVSDINDLCINSPYSSVVNMQTGCAQKAPIFSVRHIGKFSKDNETVQHDEAIGNKMAISADGNTLLVSAFEKVYVYQLSQDGWVKETVLTAPFSYDGKMNFGKSLAVDGNKILVGSNRTSASSGSSAVHVFSRDPSGFWKYDVAISADSFTGIPNPSKRQFGYAIAISGNTVIISNPMHDGFSSDHRGSVYVLHLKDDAQWEIQPKPLGIEWNDAAHRPAILRKGHEYGKSVALVGNTIMIGCPSDHSVEAVFVYTRDSSTNRWHFNERISLPEGMLQKGFGESISLSSNAQLLVGAVRKDRPNELGAAYIFEKDVHSKWVFKQTLTGHPAKKGALFGSSVALMGNKAIVGAPSDTYGRNFSERILSSAYFYAETDMGWEYTARVTSPDGRLGDKFGTSIVLHSNQALISSPGLDSKFKDVGATHAFKIISSAENF